MLKASIRVSFPKAYIISLMMMERPEHATTRIIERIELETNKKSPTRSLVPGIDNIQNFKLWSISKTKPSDSFLL
jgi:hypothetical protein